MDYSIKIIQKYIWNKHCLGISYSHCLNMDRKNHDQICWKKDIRILQDPTPDVFVGTLANSFKVRPWVKAADQWEVYFDTTENIKKKFDENNISIPFPQTDVHFLINHKTNFS